MFLAFGAFELDLRCRTLSCQGMRVALPSRPFDILVFLIAARDRVVSRDEMQVAIWPGQIVTANNLTVQVSTLRRVLARHGAGEVIITVPGRGYRFVAEVVERADCAEAAAPGPAPDEAPAAARPLRLARPVARGLGGALALAILAVAAASILSPPSGARFAVHVQVDTVPDTVGMVPGGYCRVDYVFRVLEPADLQLASEDVRFSLPSGEPIGRPSLGGRIYHGSLPIRGSGTGVYHNNIWLPPAVAASVRARNRDALYLRHNFHLVDPRGAEVIAPAVLKIVIGSPEEACRVPNGR